VSWVISQTTNTVVATKIGGTASVSGASLVTARGNGVSLICCQRSASSALNIQRVSAAVVPA